jgi:hypothetical protein
MFLIFIPSLTFNIFPSEIFPWAVILWCLYSRKIIASAIPIVVTIFLFLIYGLMKDAESFYEYLRSFFSLINPLFALFLGLSIGDRWSIQKIERKIFLPYFFCILAYLVLVAINYFYNINYLIKLFIPRASFEFVDNERGLAFLSSEPGRFAYELIFVTFTWVYLKCSREGFVLILLFIFQAIFVKSLTGYFLMAFMAVLIYHRRPDLLIIALVALFFINYIVENDRIYIIFDTIMSGDLVLVLDQMARQSGFRFAATFSSYENIFRNPLGSGVGLWSEEMLYAIENSYLKFNHVFNLMGSLGVSQIRPYSYGAAIALETGLLGILSLLYLFYRMFSSNFLVGNNHYPFSLFCIFCIFFYQDIGSPIPFFAIGLYLSYRKSIARSNFIIEKKKNFDQNGLVKQQPAAAVNAKLIDRGLIL